MPTQCILQYRDQANAWSVRTLALFGVILEFWQNLDKLGIGTNQDVSIEDANPAIACIQHGNRTNEFLFRLLAFLGLLQLQ